MADVLLRHPHLATLKRGRSSPAKPRRGYPRVMAGVYHPHLATLKRGRSSPAKPGRDAKAWPVLPGEAGEGDNSGVVATELGLTEVAADVFELRLPIPFEDGQVNCFVFPAGDEADLLDCGMNTEESVGAVRAAVKHLGAKRLRRLVTTHIHPDHYGAAGVFAGDGRADLYLHRLEVPLVHPRYVELEHLVSEVRNYLLVNGVPEDESEVMSNSQRALSDIVKPAVPAVQLDGAETLELGRRQLRVEWTPGHSPGHICLYDESEKILFAGDHMLPELSPNIGLHPQSTPDPLHEYLDGLGRLARYEPRLILPAHGRPFTGASVRVETLVAHHKRRMDQIAGIVARGERTAWEVALELWGPRENPYEKRLALQEGLAHLQALAVDGRVQKFVTPTSVRWRR